MGKEEIIKGQIEGLNTQRKTLVNMIDMLDSNSMQYFNKENTINNQVNTIDIQINQLIDKL